MSESIRVLIVDDHPVYRAGLIGCLREDPGIAVIGEAGNAQDVLREAARLNPDLVLMDISLSELNRIEGIDATRRLCAKLPQMRVLILSMHNKSGYVAKSVAAGAAGYVLKSSGGAELLRGIRVVHDGVSYYGKGVEYPPRPSPLTKREIEVVCHTANSKSAKDIGNILGISDRTVQSHLDHIYCKLDSQLDSHNAVALTLYAIKHGLCLGLL